MWWVEGVSCDLQFLPSSVYLPRGYSPQEVCFMINFRVMIGATLGITLGMLIPKRSPTGPIEALFNLSFFSISIADAEEGQIELRQMTSEMNIINQLFSKWSTKKLSVKSSNHIDHWGLGHKDIHQTCSHNN